MAMKKEMMIGAWVEPTASPKAYRLAKEMGLTHLFIGDSAFGIERGTEAFADVLRLCERMGLRAIVRNMNRYPVADTTDYSQFPAVAGINYWDEPFDTDFEKLISFAEEHDRRYGYKIFCFNNLNPNETSEYWHPWSADKDYETYVEEYCKKILPCIHFGEKWLSCDIYPLIMRDGKVTVKETWLDGVGCIARAAKKYGAEPHFFVQVSSWMDYPPMTEAGLRYQFSVEMAFGIRHFTYFTYADYCDPSGQSATFTGITDRTGEVLRVQYDYAKRINAEMKCMQEKYLSWSWQKTVAVAGKKTQNLFGKLAKAGNDLPEIKKARASADLLIGHFLSPDNENIYALANFQNPFDSEENAVELELSVGLHVLIFIGGKQTEKILNQGKLQLVLAPGEGAFVWLKKIKKGECNTK